MTGANYERYQQTKLANLVFTYALRDKLAAKGSKVKALCAHPGVAPTSLMLNTMVSATWQRACYLPCISLACTSLTMVSSLSQRLPCLSRSARACLHSSANVRVHALTCSPPRLLLASTSVPLQVGSGDYGMLAMPQCLATFIFRRLMHSQARTRHECD